MTQNRPIRTACPGRSRTDRWTPERQIAFLAALADSRSVTAAAAAAGMSRESAHRLRNRPGAALFAALWDLALAPARHGPGEGHNRALGEGRLLRLLGNHYRRESGDFARVGAASPESPAGDRTWPL